MKVSCNLSYKLQSLYNAMLVIHGNSEVKCVFIKAQFDKGALGKLSISYDSFVKFHSKKYCEHVTVLYPFVL